MEPTIPKRVMLLLVFMGPEQDPVCRSNMPILIFSYIKTPVWSICLRKIHVTPIRSNQSIKNAKELQLCKNIISRSSALRDEWSVITFLNNAASNTLYSLLFITFEHLNPLLNMCHQEHLTGTSPDPGYTNNRPELIVFSVKSH
jgi:hypothetical protein